jgi:hypothetical protein
MFAGVADLQSVFLPGLTIIPARRKLRNLG